MVPMDSPPGILTLLDWKSGTYRGPEMALQLGAYYGTTHLFDGEAMAWLPQDGLRPTQAAIVTIRPEQCKVLVKLSRADCETAFTKFRECHDIFLWLVDKGFTTIPEKEEYRIEGRQFPSVTYIIQHVIAKPGLLNWHYEMGLKAACELVNQETLIRPIALDTKEEMTALKERVHTAGLGPYARRDARAAEGSNWHKMILFFLMGKTVDLTAAPKDQTQMLLQFERWSRKVKLDPRWLETKVANLEIGYAGTADCLALCNLEEEDVTTRT